MSTRKNITVRRGNPGDRYHVYLIDRKTYRLKRKSWFSKSYRRAYNLADRIPEGHATVEPVTSEQKAVEVILLLAALFVLFFLASLYIGGWRLW